MSEKIRLGIVGYGNIAKKHLEALQNNDLGIECVAICDINPNALIQATTTHQVEGYQTLSEMLAQKEIDVVTLCTPSGLHAKQAIAVAAAKKHVITEKPMAIHYADGKAMRKVCDDNGVKLFVVKQNRFHPTIALLKQSIIEKRFGRVFMVNCNVFWTRPTSYYTDVAWRGTWEMDGGALMNQGSHYIDLLYYLFGPVASVHAMTATLDRPIETEDSAMIQLRWRSGTLGSLNLTVLTYPKNLEASLTVIGETGTVKIGGTAVNEIQHWQFAETKPCDHDIEAINQKTKEGVGSGYVDYYSNVVATLRNEARAMVDGCEGLKSLELLTATYLSARDGKLISLPLDL